jgi:hypothetical protein
MLAAESLGLGTCLLGIVSPCLERDRAWRRAHGVPDANKLGLTLIMGYRRFAVRRGLLRRLASVTWA